MKFDLYASNTRFNAKRWRSPEISVDVRFVLKPLGRVGSIVVSAIGTLILLAVSRGGQ